MPFGYMSMSELAHEDARVWLEKYFAPGQVAQAAADFVSHDMSNSGDICSVGGGRASRISYINNDGYFDRELTPEIVGDHLEQICDLRGAVPVRSLMEESLRYTKWLPRTGGRVGIL